MPSINKYQYSDNLISWLALLYDEISSISSRVTTLEGQVPTLGTPQATTSGTVWDFTIPSWAKVVACMYDGFSTNGTGHYLIRIGDSGGVENTGYASSTSQLTDAAAVAVDSSTSGFIVRSANAAQVVHGVVFLSLMNSSTNTWTASGGAHRSDAVRQITCSGSKSLSGALTTVRFTSVGPDTGDAGSVNVMYW